MKSGTNANPQKHDPYKTLLKVAAVLIALVVVSAVVFLACNSAVIADYKTKRSQVDQANAEGAQDFAAKMDVLRASNATTVNPDTGEVTPVQADYWEKTLDDVVWRLEDASATELENVRTETVDRATLLTGGMLLVNPWHPLPTDFSEAGLVSVGNASGWKIAVADNNVKLFPSAYQALDKMIADAATAGQKDYLVREAYRTNDTQTALFNKRMEALSGKYSGDVLIEQTKKTVNYPGTSEYQTGLSFRMDIYSKSDPAVGKQKFQESAPGQWMTNNSWKYGFIFRFPSNDFPNASWEDKSYKTGVSAQINLYRFVGEANAAAMTIMDYCLEEYVEFLISHPHICIYKDGALQYEIYRYTTADAPSYDVPVLNPASSYIASLDNMGGVVMSYSYVQ